MACLLVPSRNRIHLRPSDLHFLSFNCGTISSAVSSLLYLRDAAGNHADTRTGTYIYDGDAAKAMTKVFDGQRGDAVVAAQEVGFDNLFEIVDGGPRGIETLIQHMRGMVFPWTEHETE